MRKIAILGLIISLLNVGCASGPMTAEEREARRQRAIMAFSHGLQTMGQSMQQQSQSQTCTLQGGYGIYQMRCQ